ncbi:MAG: alginate lyase family protein [Bellilinea sp.]
MHEWVGVKNRGMLRNFRKGFLALRELGIQQASLYGLYRLGLSTGYFKLRTPVKHRETSPAHLTFQPLFSLPAKTDLIDLLGDQREILLEEANQILQGRVRLFGGDPVPLALTPGGTNQHWSQGRVDPGEDIKFIWEPARFGWVFTLGRAYRVSEDERYPEAFWKFWELFTTANPVNCGPNWESGQEVALRLMAYLFAHQVFSNSPHSTQDRKVGLLQAVADHADRIPPTLIYARSQNNNHWVSEACGLYLAGVALPDHPRARYWRKMGWHWLEIALRTQFDADGTYVQHSMNYHRMVLHLALIGQAAAHRVSGKYSAEVIQKLAAGTRWLIEQMDSKSGDAPNLGNNDGANILPLASGNFRDFRSTAQAAALAFLGNAELPAGPWDELSAWLGLEISSRPDHFVQMDSLAVRRLGNLDEWATLRAVRYRSRPAHADQLHVELWFNGVNILKDPGTYSYSQNPPWENSLVRSQYHNTLTIDDSDPMERAGKFLWLQWDQAQRVEESCVPGRILTAEHDGYQRLGMRHRRSLEWIQPGEWEVTDWVIPKQSLKSHHLTVQWLLPDGQWTFEENRLILIGRQEIVNIMVHSDQGNDLKPVNYRVVRGGENLSGEGSDFPNHGWYSPTYAALEPAISYQATFTFNGPTTIKTSIHVERIPQEKGST